VEPEEEEEGGKRGRRRGGNLKTARSDPRGTGRNPWRRIVNDLCLSIIR
jgi:hypothetical protein